MRCAAAFFAWRWFYTLWDGAAWQIRPVFTKKDCFWQNREFSTNKLGLLTIYKSVIVPNTDNMKGLEAAAAAGIVAGKQEKKLEVIADVSPEQTKAIRAYLDQTDIKVRHVENGVTFDIILTVWKGEHSAQVRIAVFHTNIVHVEKDGEVLVDIPVHGDSEETLTDRSLLDMEHIWDFANTVDVEDVRSILEPQIRCNMAIAEEGLRGSYGANIGSVLLGYNMYIRGNQFRAGDGIVAKGVENSLKNVGRLGRQGMKETNNEIIDIMVGG